MGSVFVKSDCMENNSAVDRWRRDVQVKRNKTVFHESFLYDVLLYFEEKKSLNGFRLLKS